MYGTVETFHVKAYSCKEMKLFFFFVIEMGHMPKMAAMPLYRKIALKNNVHEVKRACLIQKWLLPFT